MENIIQKTTEELNEKISHRFDAEIKRFLDIHSLPLDKEELERKGFRLVIEEKGNITYKETNVILLKVVDKASFIIKTSLTIEKNEI
jgi:hypothetical protein